MNLFALFVALMGKTVECYGKCCVSYVTSVPYAQWCLLSVQDVTSMQHRSVPKKNIFLHNFSPPYLPFPASLLARSFCITLQQGTAEILHPVPSKHRQISAFLPCPTRHNSLWHIPKRPVIMVSGVPRNFVSRRGGGFNKFSWGQRERGSGGGSLLVRVSGGSCNLVKEISFHIVKFS